MRRVVKKFSPLSVAWRLPLPSRHLPCPLLRSKVLSCRAATVLHLFRGTSSSWYVHEDGSFSRQYTLSPQSRRALRTGFSGVFFAEVLCILHMFYPHNCNSTGWGVRLDRLRSVAPCKINVRNEPVQGIFCVVKLESPPVWMLKLCEFQHRKSIYRIRE